jgi:hypothetical protein
MEPLNGARAPGELSRRQWTTGVAATLAGSLVSSPAAAWEQIDEGDGVRVFRKEMPNSDLVAFRGEALLDSPIEKLLWVLGDNEHRTDWVDRLEKSVLLERISPYEYVVYQQFDLPFPISDRDYVYRGKAVRGNAGKVVLHMQSIEHPKAPKTVGVRANLIRSKYELIPKGKQQTIVIVEIHTDPKGLIPTWLVNAIQKGWPRKTLVALGKQVKNSYVKSAPLPG